MKNWKNWESDVALFLLAGFCAAGVLMIGDSRTDQLIAAVKALLLGQA